MTAAAWIGVVLRPVLKGRRPNLAQPDRHRPGYFRDYYARHRQQMRAYHRARAERARRARGAPIMPQMRRKQS